MFDHDSPLLSSSSRLPYLSLASRIAPPSPCPHVLAARLRIPDSLLDMDLESGGTRRNLFDEISTASPAADAKARSARPLLDKENRPLPNASRRHGGSKRQLKQLKQPGERKLPPAERARPEKKAATQPAPSAAAPSATAAEQPAAVSLGGVPLGTKALAHEPDAASPTLQECMRRHDAYLAHASARRQPSALNGASASALSDLLLGLDMKRA